MTDLSKGAVAAPKILEPHPLDLPGAPMPGKRAEEVRTERRRRADMDYEYESKLGVDHALLDHSKFAYRWINDIAGRLHHKTVNDDWDIVRDPKVPDEKGHIDGAQVRHLAQSNIDGSPLWTYLCRKPLVYHNADRARKQRQTDANIADIARGKHTSDKQGNALASTEQPTTYIPDGGISITHEQAKVTSYKP